MPLTECTIITHFITLTNQMRQLQVLYTLNLHLKVAKFRKSQKPMNKTLRCLMRKLRLIQPFQLMKTNLQSSNISSNTNKLLGTFHLLIKYLSRKFMEKLNPQRGTSTREIRQLTQSCIKCLMIVGSLFRMSVTMKAMPKVMMN